MNLVSEGLTSQVEPPIAGGSTLAKQNFLPFREIMRLCRLAGGSILATYYTDETGKGDPDWSDGETAWRLSLGRSDDLTI